MSRPRRLRSQRPSSSSRSAGCATTERNAPPTAFIPPRDLIDLDAAPGTYQTYDPQKAIANLRQHRPSGNGSGTASRNLLALSGGGMYRVLYGGRAQGVDRLGQAAGLRRGDGHQHRLADRAVRLPRAGVRRLPRAEIHSVLSADIYEIRPWVTMLWSDSIARSDPLRDMIASQIDDALLDKIAAAHAQGRRLYIGTTNLDSKRLVVWDMGAIASSGRPGRAELFRTVVLASCSVPGVLPPVSIDVSLNGVTATELHADGSVTASVFADLYMLRAPRPPAGAPETQPVEGANVYAIVAGKIYAEPGRVQKALFSVTGQSLLTVLQARSDGDLMRLFLMATLSGGRFQLASVPQDMPVGANALDFEPATMRKLFDAGYKFAAAGRDWRNTPPGAEPDEQTLPRSGVRFVTAPDAARPRNAAAIRTGKPGEPIAGRTHGPSRAMSPIGPRSDLPGSLSCPAASPSRRPATRPGRSVTILNVRDGATALPASSR